VHSQTDSSSSIKRIRSKPKSDLREPESGQMLVHLTLSLLLEPESRLN
ncbi:438_t:CDS:1, partial [Racocetra fulgida]